ncbi:NAD(P)/FAD-dependent oxidoreductase [Actinomadura algeriensis]|uniref:3-phenylpropionate/trans-cinnamate dioxygenase ferredoxin reductase subunit n=1 Tax=Actinomadura algeriensis TaxID=1679523 RepID=A0ABR9JWU4_9ACTN|nr:FAD-dependent oxidoreductase [Actinomadura algeriensis]MBE1535017.1 3-phenylpropionate/trans-cinnamate dioxygenase ferredoxin reductase subunit [Actinomadura algeriensis]
MGGIMPDGTFVIVGAGLTGAKAAETLREEGFAGRIVLIGEEIERPYERPPLSKGFLLGAEPRDKAHVHDAEWYGEHDVELRLGVAVDALDAAAHVVRLAGGERIGYDRALLATGAAPRRLDVPGARLQGIHYLRTMADAAALKQALVHGGRRVVVAGAGWIGLETAAAARAHGNEVTVIEPEPVPLHRSVGPEIGGMFADLHRDNGVDLRLEQGVAGFWGAGQVSAAVTSGGAEVPADVVIVGIGVRPNTGLAEGAGLEVSDGILVDRSLRTSDADVFAAGDVANAYNPLLGRRIRVEHWANALNGGPAAARAMLGREVVYDRVPYFFSDQFDLGMEMSGVASPGEYDEVVYRGDRGSGEFVAFWLSGGRVVAGMNVNVWDVTGDVQELIRSGRPVDAARLADPGVPLADLR